MTATTYKIIRFRFHGDPEVIEHDLTLEEAQAHCHREDTHGDGWFDGYGVDVEGDEDDEAVIEVTTYTPVDNETATSLIGEGLHTGLRKGTEAPGHMALWQAVADSNGAWEQALDFLVDGLGIMGYVLCKRETS